MSYPPYPAAPPPQPQSGPGYGWGPPAPGGPLEIAPMRMRVVAYLVDSIAASVVIAPFSVAAGISAAVSADTSSTSSMDGALFPGIDPLTVALGLAVVVVMTLYFALMQGSQGAWNGQTLGKRLAGVRVVQVDGSRLTRGAAWGRAVVYVLPSLLFGTAGQALDLALDSGYKWTVVGAGLWQLFWIPAVVIAPTLGRRRATVHDRLAGTVVVKAGSSASEPTAEPATAIAERATSGLTRTAAILGGLWAFAGLSIAVFGLLVDIPSS